MNKDEWIKRHPLCFKAFWEEEKDKEYISTGDETVMDMVEMWAGKYLNWFIEKTKCDCALKASLECKGEEG